jgi:uncharacterized protein YndB with AHSA1/START domain
MHDSKAQLAIAHTTGRRQILFGSMFALGGFAAGSPVAWAGAGDEISRSAESIHQEVFFKATRKRVYEALTDAAQFHKVVLLSMAAQTGMVPIKTPAEISRELGGAFEVFGGYISGRQIELLPGERIVQAWRAGSWDPGIYSIARFELAEDAAGTKLVFDHTGFPVGKAQHLADGWNSNYWQPLAKFLSQ